MIRVIQTVVAMATLAVLQRVNVDNTQPILVHMHAGYPELQPVSLARIARERASPVQTELLRTFRENAVINQSILQ